MLKRKIYDKLLRWKNDSEKVSLMIEGARQVGKTFIIREFGKNEYKSFIEINFAKKPEYKNIFNGNLDSNTIFEKMTYTINGVKLIPKETLIFLDEIQLCGNARTAIKFLVEDGRFDIITSGSLLSLSNLDDDDPDVEEPISLPTGYEDFITMYSLDFEEFLWALGFGNEGISNLKEFFNNKKILHDDICKKYEDLFRQYIVIGGMPEVVANFVEYHDFGKVSKIQRRILKDYIGDITKHAKGKEKQKALKCYQSIPTQLAKENKKFIYSVVEANQSSKKYGGSIHWLIDTSLVNISKNIKNPILPLNANVLKDQFKLYINDTGLLCEMYGFETKKAILDGELTGETKGGIYENAIAENLIKNGYTIYYYKPDDYHEIEFIIEKSDCGVVPIEVKASNKATVSLNNFIKKYNPKIAYKLIDGNLGVVDSKYTIPHFMVMFI